MQGVKLPQGGSVSKGTTEMQEHMTVQPMVVYMFVCWSITYATFRLFVMQTEYRSNFVVTLTALL